MTTILVRVVITILALIPLSPVYGQLGELLEKIEKTVKDLGDSLPNPVIPPTGNDNENVGEEAPIENRDVKSDQNSSQENSATSRTPMTLENWYEYLSGHWNLNQKCVTSAIQADGVYYERTKILFLDALKVFLIEDGRQVLEGTFTLSDRGSENEVDLDGWYDVAKGKKVDIQVFSRLRFLDQNTFLIVSQRGKTKRIILNGKYIETGIEAIARRCDTTEMITARKQYALDQEKKRKEESERRAEEARKEQERRAEEARKEQERRAEEARKLQELNAKKDRELRELRLRELRLRQEQERKRRLEDLLRRSEQKEQESETRKSKPKDSIVN